MKRNSSIGSKTMYHIENYLRSSAGRATRRHLQRLQINALIKSVLEPYDKNTKLRALNREAHPVI